MITIKQINITWWESVSVYDGSDGLAKKIMQCSAFTSFAN